MITTNTIKTMSESEEHSSDESLQCRPLDLKEAAESTKLDLLPAKSKQLYESTYDTFVKWKRQRKSESTSESIVMAYFKELSKKYKPSTLWSIYSMLKATLKIKEKIDIDNYHVFKAFMKKQSSGFKSKKSSVFSSKEIEKFLTDAPDNEYLATKVALIFGISGACRSNELVVIKLADVVKQGDLLVVNLPTGKTKRPRAFVVAQELAKIVRRYENLRPKNATTDRFFLNFQKGKCTVQVIGRHKFAKMPKEIAVYLKLDNPESYTGHAFRSTAKLLTDRGSNVATFKLCGRRKPSGEEAVKKEFQSIDEPINKEESVEEPVEKEFESIDEPIKKEFGNVEEPVKKEFEISNVISTLVNFASAQPFERSTEDPATKRKKIETATAERVISDAQSSANTEETSPLKNTIVFNNCSFVINQNS